MKPRVWTLREVGELLDRLRSIRAECSHCERVEVFEQMIPGPQISPGPGWNPSQTEYAWIKPCANCAATPMYPWAAYLDAERVLEHLKSTGNPGVIIHARLRQLTEGSKR